MNTWANPPLDSDICPHCGHTRRHRGRYGLYCIYPPCTAYGLPDWYDCQPA